MTSSITRNDIRQKIDDYVKIKVNEIAADVIENAGRLMDLNFRVAASNITYDIEHADVTYSAAFEWIRNHIKIKATTSEDGRKLDIGFDCDDLDNLDDFKKDLVFKALSNTQKQLNYRR